MFKKIEIWILYLVILIGLVASITFGVLVRQGIEGKTELGSFSIKFLTNPLVEFVRFPEKFVTIILKPNVWKINDPWDEQRHFWDIKGFEGGALERETYLLLSRYNGDLDESVVELVDLRTFGVLHTWNPDFDLFNNLVDANNPLFKNLKRDAHDKRAEIRHPFFTQDGGLIIHSENSPLRKIDSCSKLVWQNQDQGFHHSIEEDYEGNFWMPTSHINLDYGNLNDDAITKVSPQGRTLFQKSLSKLFTENNLEYLLFAIGGEVFFELDPFHLNDIEPVLKDGKYWNKGDIFLSLRNQSMVILYRPSTNEIIWTGTGYTFQQHDIGILDDHRISIFNNNSKRFDGELQVDGNSEVVIYDFEINQYSKYLNNFLIENDFRTRSQGQSQIIDNNDLFVLDSEYGRLLYFKADGSLKWQYINSAENGNIYNVFWSRILYKPTDIEKVQNLLTTNSCKSE